MNDDVLHVTPVGDLIAHDTRSGEPTCACGPAYRLYRRAESGDGWLLVHHSLDGREQGEDTAPPRA